MYERFCKDSHAFLLFFTVAVLLLLFFKLLFFLGYACYPPFFFFCVCVRVSVTSECSVSKKDQKIAFNFFFCSC